MGENEEGDSILAHWDADVLASCERTNAQVAQPSTGRPVDYFSRKGRAAETDVCSGAL
jgi:hypothetical protein